MVRKNTKYIYINSVKLKILGTTRFKVVDFLTLHKSTLQILTLIPNITILNLIF